MASLVQTKFHDIENTIQGSQLTLTSSIWTCMLVIQNTDHMTHTCTCNMYTNITELDGTVLVAIISTHKLCGWNKQ